MKKVFLAFLLFAGLATCFSGCKKDEEKPEPTPPTPPAPTYTNTFAIGDDSYDIKLAGIIENISFGEMNINVVAFASKQEPTAANNNAICVIYYGDITSGAIDVAPAPLPRVVALKDFKLQDLLQDISSIMTSPNAYFAASGSLTLAVSGDTYTVTTKNLILAKQDNTVYNGNIDYQGATTKIELSSGIGSFSINDTEYQIIKAGTMYYQFMGVNQHLMGFISSDMTKLVAVTIGETIPEGDFSVPTPNVILINDFNPSTMSGTPAFATSGNITITKTDGSNYHVVITNATYGTSLLNLEYTGTILPFNM